MNWGKIPPAICALAIAGMAAAWAMPAPDNDAMREFTDKNGRKVEARLVNLDEEKVTLELANGRKVEVKLDSLSEADQKFVKEQQAEKEDEPQPSKSYFGGDAVPVTWQYDAQPNGIGGLKSAKFNVWIPDSDATLRGMIVVVPGFNDSNEELADDDRWKELAGELGLGLIVCEFKSDKPDSTAYLRPDGGSGMALMLALGAFADGNGHPEVKTAPLFFWGEDEGGQFGFNFACWRPEQTAGFVMGGACKDCVPPTDGVSTIPALFFAGEEPCAELREIYVANRAKGALWAFANGDEEHDSNFEIARQFFRSLAELRLGANATELNPLTEKSGWLAKADTASVVEAATAGISEPESCCWFPDQKTAELWLQAAR